MRACSYFINIRIQQVATIRRVIDFGSLAGHHDGPADIRNNPIDFGFYKPASVYEYDFSAQQPFCRDICRFETGIFDVDCQFRVVVEDILTSAVKMSILLPEPVVRIFMNAALHDIFS